MRDKEHYKRNTNKYNNFKAPKGGDQSQSVVNDTLEPHTPIQAQPLEVKVFGGNFERSLRSFRALVQKERILSTYKEKQSYEKPSDKNRRKRNEMSRKRQELSNEDFDRKPKSHKSKSPPSEGTTKE